jgi:hypothetical protein
MTPWTVRFEPQEFSVKKKIWNFVTLIVTLLKQKTANASCNRGFLRSRADLKRCASAASRCPSIYTTPAPVLDHGYLNTTNQLSGVTTFICKQASLKAMNLLG